MEVIDPRVVELERKYQELSSAHAQLRGEVLELRHTARDTSRQTIWQFVIFTVTMGAIAIGGIKYQSDTLRREMDICFDAQRQEMNARFDAMEKRFEDLKQEVRANRK